MEFILLRRYDERMTPEAVAQLDPSKMRSSTFSPGMRLPTQSHRGVVYSAMQPDYTQVSPAKIALRRHLNQERTAQQSPVNLHRATKTIGDLVNGEIERTLEISNQCIINAAVNMSGISEQEMLAKEHHVATTKKDYGFSVVPGSHRGVERKLTYTAEPSPNAQTSDHAAPHPPLEGLAASLQARVIASLQIKQETDHSHPQQIQPRELHEVHPMDLQPMQIKQEDVKQDSQLIYFQGAARSVVDAAPPYINCDRQSASLDSTISPDTNYGAMDEKQKGRRQDDGKSEVFLMAVSRDRICKRNQI